MKRTLSAIAMLGCVRFLQGYYIIFVTQRRKVGCIGGNYIYGIQATQEVPVSVPREGASAWSWVNNWLNPSPEDEAEARYLGLFHFLDLTKDFYFSYSYDLTRALQNIMTASSDTPPDERFSWNYFLTSQLRENFTVDAAADLIQPMIFGSFEQKKCAVFGRLVSVILLARRSRHFAGTRYLKRGVSDSGNVANDVELEQIIEDESMGEGRFSSFIQYRGSIPIYWTQETSVTVPKPTIVLNRVDPTYAATRKHFANLFHRYGSPILVLNLVKQSEKREREVIVGNEFRCAVQYINSFMPPEHRIQYIALDYSKISKQKDLNVLRALDEVAVWSLKQTGFFCSAPKRQIGEQGKKFDGVKCYEPKNQSPQEDFKSPPPSPTLPRYSRDWVEQNGVLRVNCIDCLDRTNVGQFSVGMRALGQQLYVMGLKNSPILKSDSQLVRVLMHLYSNVGDTISFQYGGSEAHKNVKDGPGKEKVKHRELLTSIRRYYSNSFTDMVKQDAINVFLGNFRPQHGEPPLWELESDYYLHNFNVEKGADGAILPHPIKKRIRQPQVQNINQLFERRRQRRRDALERKRISSEWWIGPLQTFDCGKFNTQNRKSIAMSERFLQMYHTQEMTFFDQALEYEFMKPIDLSHDTKPVDSLGPQLEKQNSIQEFARDRCANGSALSANGDSYWLPTDIMDRAKAALISAAGITAPDASTYGPSSLEEFAASCGIDILANSKLDFIGSCRSVQPLSLYEQYVDTSRLAEKEAYNNPQCRKWYKDTYLYDFEIDPDDAHAVKEAQRSGGAAFTITNNKEHHGLNQTESAREHIHLKPDREAQRIYEDTIDPEYLTRLPETIASSKTHHMYASYFEQSLLKPKRTNIPGIVSILESQVVNNTDSVEPMGALYRNPNKSFVLFNDAAAENEFGQALEDDEKGQLSFYDKK